MDQQALLERIKAAIAAAEHPEITAVTPFKATSSNKGLRTDFVDGSSVYLTVGDPKRGGAL